MKMWFSKVLNPHTPNLVWWSVCPKHFILREKKSRFGHRCHGNGGHLGFKQHNLRAAFYDTGSSNFFLNAVYGLAVSVSWITQSDFLLNCELITKRYDKSRIIPNVCEKSTKRHIFQGYIFFLQISLWVIQDINIIIPCTKFQNNSSYRYREKLRAWF